MTTVRAPARATTLRVLLRGLRCRCPVCGTGRVFLRGVESARECDVCGWRLERCLGHWIGGNEINVLATFSAGVATWLACLPIVGLGTASAVIATAVTAAFAVAFYRPSRGLFFALDYLLDPDPATDQPPAAPPGASDRGGDRDGDGDRGGRGDDRRDDYRDPRRVRSSPPPAAAPTPAPTTASAVAPSSSESFIPPPGTPYPPPSTVSP